MGKADIKGMYAGAKCLLAAFVFTKLLVSSLELACDYGTNCEYASLKKKAADYFQVYNLPKKQAGFVELTERVNRIDEETHLERYFKLCAYGLAR